MEIKQMFKPSTFYASLGDIVVTGFNGENADMDNPRGEEYGQQVVVVAESERGDRAHLVVAVAHPHWAEEELPKAEKVAAALNARLARGLLPVGFSRWSPARPCYGSDAYVAYGQADDVALEAREAEYC
jgi:hypothetical protein